MNRVIDKYFAVLKDYFGEALKIASKSRFLRLDYLKTLGTIYGDNDVVLGSILDSLYDELASLDWASQEKSVQQIDGLKVSYIGSTYVWLRHVSTTSDFLRKTALYADTIVFKDDVLSELITY